MRVCMVMQITNELSINNFLLLIIGLKDNNSIWPITYMMNLHENKESFEFVFDKLPKRFVVTANISAADGIIDLILFI